MIFIFIAGIIFLLGFLFVPIGTLNNEILVLVPIFTNELSDKNIWEWQNTAAFIFTYFVSIILLIYFRNNGQKLGVSIGLVVNLVSLMIIFIIIWMMKTGLSGFDSFEYSYGWIFWVAGFLLVLIDRNKKPVAS